MSIKSPLLSTHIKHTITLADVREQFADFTIPTTQPATPQIQYTILESDLPTIEPPMYQNMYIAHFYVATYNNSGASKTVRVAIFLNGVEVQTGTGTNNNGQYCTLMCRRLDVQVGDTLGIAVWEDTGSVTAVLQGLSVTLSRLYPQKNAPLMNLKLSGLMYVPRFTGVDGTQNIFVNRYVLNHLGRETEGRTTTAYEFPSWHSEGDRFIARQQYGDSYTTHWFHTQSGTSRPLAYGNSMFTVIEYEVPI